MLGLPFGTSVAFGAWARRLAADRAHRIGQENPVMVHRLIATDTVEEKILALQERKRGIAEQTLAGSNHGGRLTQDDLLALLEP